MIEAGLHCLSFFVGWGLAMLVVPWIRNLRR